jgi:hypothetical protein
MPCCETCSCLGCDFECLAVVAPERYRHFAEWCRGDNPSRRMLVRDMSRMGLAAIDAMNPKSTVPATDAPTGGAEAGGPMPVAGPPSIALAGDVVAALAAAVGIDRLAKWAAKVATGVPDCNCLARQQKLNEIDARARRLVARLAGRR